MPPRAGPQRRGRQAGQGNARRVAGNEFLPPHVPFPRHDRHRNQNDDRRLSSKAAKRPNELRCGHRRRRHRRTGDGISPAGSAAANQIAAARKGIEARRAPDRQQQRRAALRPLLQTRLGKGEVERQRPARNGRVLPRSTASPTNNAAKSSSPLPRKNCRDSKISGNAEMPTACSVCGN